LQYSNFPKKLEIQYKYDLIIKSTRDELNELKIRREELFLLYEKIKNEVNLLKRVNVDVFKKMLISSNQQNDMLDYYQRGVFAEWEDVPEWFEKAVNEMQG